MAFPQALVTRFFQLLNNRQLTEASRELQRVREKVEENQWNLGYCKALSGMLLASKTNGNQYIFLSRINLKDEVTIQQYKREFSQRVQSRFHDNFDRGYFSAWSDYMSLLAKTIIDRRSRQSLDNQTSIVQYADSARKTM